MNKVPEITLQHYKDWAKRNDMRIRVSDEELQEALTRGNTIAQELKDQREEAKRLAKKSPE